MSENPGLVKFTEERNSPNAVNFKRVSVKITVAKIKELLTLLGYTKADFKGKKKDALMDMLVEAANPSQKKKTPVEEEPEEKPKAKPEEKPKAKPKAKPKVDETKDREEHKNKLKKSFSDIRDYLIATEYVRAPIDVYAKNKAEALRLAKEEADRIAGAKALRLAQDAANKKAKAKASPKAAPKAIMEAPKEAEVEFVVPKIKVFPYNVVNDRLEFNPDRLNIVTVFNEIIRDIFGFDLDLETLERINKFKVKGAPLDPMLPEEFEKQIDKKFRSMSFKYHPDKIPKNISDQKRKEALEYFTLLSNYKGIAREYGSDFLAYLNLVKNRVLLKKRPGESDRELWDRYRENPQQGAAEEEPAIKRKPMPRSSFAEVKDVFPKVGDEILVLGMIGKAKRMRVGVIEQVDANKIKYRLYGVEPSPDGKMSFLRHKLEKSKEIDVTSPFEFKQDGMIYSSDKNKITPNPYGLSADLFKLVVGEEPKAKTPKAKTPKAKPKAEPPKAAPKAEPKAVSSRPTLAIKAGDAEPKTKTKAEPKTDTFFVPKIKTFRKDLDRIKLTEMLNDIAVGVFGVDPNLDDFENQIEKKYRKMAFKYHPDKLPRNLSEADRKRASDYISLLTAYKGVVKGEAFGGKPGSLNLMEQLNRKKEMGTFKFDFKG